jgi:predicted phosphodiesterase
MADICIGRALQFLLQFLYGAPPPRIFDRRNAVMTVRLAPRLAAIAAALLGLAPLQTAQAKILAQWVEMGADGNASVRAITEDACPSVIFDGRQVPMSVRAEPGRSFGNVKPAQFPVRSCEAMVPGDAVAALLDGKALPLPRPNPQRILVFGDTGCRLATGNPTQDCNDINAWPFPRIAAVAAAARPDLVIHVGDYHYREDACPANHAGCAGSPWGYGWDAWNADFFSPAAPLLAAAPWVMVRGNHEDCSRAGEGWFRFIDRLPMEPACRDFTGSFVARLGDFGIVVVDGAKAEDPKGDPSDMASTLRRQFIEIVAKVPAEAWLTTHRPLDAMLGTEKGEPRNFVGNKVLELALGADMPTGVRMYVSGHIHFFQAVDFGGKRPPQLVVGTGGDNLQALPPLSVIGADINGVNVNDSVTYSGFGYMVWDRAGNAWSGTLFDVNGKPINHCRLVNRSLSCRS